MPPHSTIYHRILYFCWKYLCVLVCQEATCHLSLSSTEAEYHAMTVTTTKITWLSYLMRDLHITPIETPILYCDNLSALHLTVNPIFHARTKHLEIDFHYVREQLALHKHEMRHIPSTDQVADIFPKPLLHQPFFKNLLGGGGRFYFVI